MNNANRDFFSRFVNWLSSAGRDKPEIQRGAGRDPLSRLMNRISG